MKKNQFYSGQYLAAKDVEGHRFKVVIDRVVGEDMSDRNNPKEKITKPVVYFVGKEKGVVLGVQQWEQMELITGRDDSDNWRGLSLLLTTRTTNFGPGIWFEPDPAASPPAPVDDDEVPFAVLLPLVMAGSLLGQLI